MSSDAAGNFWKTVDALKSQGLNRTDRIYLSFVDASTYRGTGMAWNDDRADGSVNRHNILPGFSRVDSGCWSGKVTAHELMHNLGGVQNSAPNASGGFHCIDEFDVMCYADAGSVAPLLRVQCDDSSRDLTRFDCGHDDYYNTDPASGSYLDTHWNAANNRFLIGAATTSASPASPVTAAPTTSVNTDKKPKKQDKGNPKKSGKSKKQKNGNGKAKKH